MKATLHGTVNGPAAIVVGSYDPLLPGHRQLFSFLGRYGRKAGCSSVVVLLDPPPALYLEDPAWYPLYHDGETRSAMIRQAGVDAVLRVHFEDSDLHGSAADFFESVDPHLDLAELWLGRKQTLGSGDTGDTQAVLHLAESKNVEVKFLPEGTVQESANEVRRMLVFGQMRKATSVVGHAPRMRRPETGQAHRAWAPGRYGVEVRRSNAPVPHDAVARDGRSSRATAERTTIELTRADGGGCTFDWPAGVDELIFVEGPGDESRGDGVAEERSEQAVSVAPAVDRE